MPSLEIRRATTNDWELIAAHNAAMAFETEGKRLQPETLRPGTQALLRDERKGFYLLAESDGHVVGQLMVTYEWSDWRNGDFWWIQSVYVRPEARRQGAYRSLYEHLFNEAKQRPDVVGVRLYVAKSNATAQAAYRALGMGESEYDLFEVDFVLG
jgi:ribosomal protein S18 acetylase RimI-like enzyme